MLAPDVVLDQNELRHLNFITFQHLVVCLLEVVREMKVGDTLSPLIRAHAFQRKLLLWIRPYQ